MIDHLLAFPDEAAAMKACPAYVIDGAWDDSRCIAGVVVEVPVGDAMVRVPRMVDRDCDARA